MDYLNIEGLVVFAHHGVFPEENKLGQRFEISARLDLVTSHAGMQDDLSRSVDYGAVCHSIQDFFQAHPVKLIETAAEQLARHLLLCFPALHTVVLRIAKPWAPIGLPLDQVSVNITRGWHPVTVAMGSNQGDRLKNLCDALEAFDRIPGIRVKKIASFIETPAAGRHNEPPYLNGAVLFDTCLLPRECLRQLQALEKAAGRQPGEKWSTRPLDLDMIFYDDLISENPRLYLPHPRYRERDFVLKPLNDIIPYHKDPLTGESIQAILQTRQLKKGR